MPRKAPTREKTPTAHGTVEYETVRCANCEHPVITDDAVGVLIGVDYNVNYLGDVEVRKRERKNLCPQCSEALFGTGAGNGAIPTDLLRATWWRVINLGDPLFAGVFALSGAFVGVMVAWLLLKLLFALVAVVL